MTTLKILDYGDIFSIRGNSYHHAMQSLPQARANEMKAMVACVQEKLTDNTAQLTFVDFLGKGEYLKNYLPSDITYTCLEVNVFLPGQDKSYDWKSSLPLADESVDVFVTMAALHHVKRETRDFLYREVKRVLKPDGLFVIGDVFEGSFVDHFLNGFVNSFNSMGHFGQFLTLNEGKVLRDAGFDTKLERKNYKWEFPTDAEMAMFAKCLFGLDKASEEQILEGIAQHLSPSHVDGGVNFNWELGFYSMKKAQ